MTTAIHQQQQQQQQSREYESIRQHSFENQRNRAMLLKLREDEKGSLKTKITKSLIKGFENDKEYVAYINNEVPKAVMETQRGVMTNPGKIREIEMKASRKRQAVQQQIQSRQQQSQQQTISEIKSNSAHPSLSSSLIATTNAGESTANQVDNNLHSISKSGISPLTLALGGSSSNSRSNNNSFTKNNNNSNNSNNSNGKNLIDSNAIDWSMLDKLQMLKHYEEQLKERDEKAKKQQDQRYYLSKQMEEKQRIQKIEEENQLNYIRMRENQIQREEEEESKKKREAIERVDKERRLFLKSVEDAKKLKEMEEFARKRDDAEELEQIRMDLEAQRQYEVQLREESKLRFKQVQADVELKKKIKTKAHQLEAQQDIVDQKNWTEMLNAREKKREEEVLRTQLIQDRKINNFKDHMKEYWETAKKHENAMLKEAEERDKKKQLEELAKRERINQDKVKLRDYLGQQVMERKAQKVQEQESSREQAEIWKEQSSHGEEKEREEKLARRLQKLNIRRDLESQMETNRAKAAAADLDQMNDFEKKLNSKLVTNLAQQLKVINNY